VQAWLRTYQTPLWLAAAFVFLLAVFALTPEPNSSIAETTDRTVETTPGPREFAVCNIDKTFDPKEGRCVPLPSTPLPCIEGTKLDTKAGFCLPTGTPRIAAPVATIDPRVPQFPGGIGGDFPGINNHPERDR